MGIADLPVRNPRCPRPNLTQVSTNLGLLERLGAFVGAEMETAYGDCLSQIKLSQDNGQFNAWLHPALHRGRRAFQLTVRTWASPSSDTLAELLRITSFAGRDLLLSAKHLFVGALRAR